MSSTEYLLDNRDPASGARFDSLAAMFNPVTFRRIERLGIEPDWTCWEVGAGGPSVSRWLSAQVGRTGRVVASDIDVSSAMTASGGNVEVVQHDVVRDEAPAGGFDLVHARLVLVHLPERTEALRRMVGALRPGGWLLVEDFDMAMQPQSCPDEVGEDQRRANRIRVGFMALLVDRGVDDQFGRKLPNLLRRAGLHDVGADAYLPLALAAAATLDRANVIQVRELLVARGHATNDEIERHLAALDAGRLDVATPPLISAWGRHT